MSKLTESLDALIEAKAKKPAKPGFVMPDFSEMAKTIKSIPGWFALGSGNFDPKDYKDDPKGLAMELLRIRDDLNDGNFLDMNNVRIPAGFDVEALTDALTRASSKLAHMGEGIEEAAPRGKGQQAIMDYLGAGDQGAEVELTSLVRHPAFRRMAFQDVMSAAEALAKKGLITYTDTGKDRGYVLKLAGKTQAAPVNEATGVNPWSAERQKQLFRMGPTEKAFAYLTMADMEMASIESMAPEIDQLRASIQRLAKKVAARGKGGLAGMETKSKKFMAFAGRKLFGTEVYGPAVDVEEE